MAYRVKGRNGLPIQKDGNFILGYDVPVVKIEQLDEVNKSFIATASTEDEDRDKDIVRVSGWKLDNFQKNPVLPWSHNYWEPPVGKAIMIKKETKNKRLIFKPQFDSNDEKAMLIFNKYKNGYLNTFSVGFVGLEFEWRNPEDMWCGGREFTKQELLEISPVTVPANPNATVDMQLRALDGQERLPSLLDMGYKSFMFTSDKGLFIPTSDIEVFTEAREIQIGKGITAVFAVPIDAEEGNKQESIVGYTFNGFDESQAAKWVSDFSEKSNKVHYYDMKGLYSDSTEGENGEIEIIECDYDVDSNILNVKNPQGETEETLEGEEETPHVEAEKGITEEEETVEIPEVKTDDSTIPTFKLSDEQMDKLVILLGENLKKNLAIPEQVKEDNEQDLDISSLEADLKSETNEEIELDDSLFPPVSDSDDSENFIEVDEESIKGIGKGKINMDIETICRKSLEVVLGELSGKLD